MVNFPRSFQAIPVYNPGSTMIAHGRCRRRLTALTTTCCKILDPFRPLRPLRLCGEFPTMIAHRSRHPDWKTVAIAASALLAASCAARKPLPPLPVYPPIPENAVQQLRYLPSKPYDKLQTVTIEGEVGTQYSSALQDARQAAAQKGGNAMILVEDKDFRRTINGQQRIVRRTIYWVVHLK